MSRTPPHSIPAWTKLERTFSPPPAKKESGPAGALTLTKKIENRSGPCLRVMAVHLDFHAEYRYIDIRKGTFTWLIPITIT
jgi:hypothetical protein